MPKIIPPGYIDIAQRITRTGDDRAYIVTFGAEIAAVPFTGSNAVALSNAMSGYFAQILASSERVSTTTISVGQDGPPIVYQHDPNLAGAGGASALLPQNCAVLVRKTTAAGGRRNRGRLFWPSIAESLVGDTGLLTSAGLTAYQTTFDSIHSILDLGNVANTNVINAVLFHSSGVATPTVVTRFLVQSLLATQRRRLRR